MKADTAKRLGYGVYVCASGWSVCDVTSEGAHQDGCQARDGANPLDENEPPKKNKVNLKNVTGYAGQ